MIEFRSFSKEEPIEFAARLQVEYEKRRGVRSDTCVWPDKRCRLRLSLMERGKTMSKRQSAPPEFSFSHIFVTKMHVCMGTLSVRPTFLFHAGYSSLKSVRPHPGRPFFHTQPRSTPGLIPRPPAVQPVHGRTDWASKYASRR